MPSDLIVTIEADVLFALDAFSEYTEYLLLATEHDPVPEHWWFREAGGSSYQPRRGGFRGAFMPVLQYGTSQQAAIAQTAAAIADGQKLHQWDPP